MLSSHCFHLLCYPEKLKPLLDDLLRRRQLHQPSAPFIIWEPAPPSCVNRKLDEFLESAKLVDIFSPNHLELLSLFDRADEVFDQATIEKLSLVFLERGVGPRGKGAVIVRAGEHGCVVMSSDRPPLWIPAYYEHGERQNSHERIVDTTGAGNAFLGGFIIGYNKTKDLVQAVHYGTVAASFAVEQIGVPRFEKSSETREYWNGEIPSVRLTEFQRRLDDRR